MGTQDADRRGWARLCRRDHRLGERCLHPGRPHRQPRNPGALRRFDGNPGYRGPFDSGKILVKDAIADIALQQVLTRPTEFDVIATLNLNGDGGIGARTVTYDFARLMEGAKLVKTSEFGDAVIAHMG